MRECVIFPFPRAPATRDYDTHLLEFISHCHVRFPSFVIIAVAVGVIIHVRFHIWATRSGSHVVPSYAWRKCCRHFMCDTTAAAAPTRQTSVICKMVFLFQFAGGKSHQTLQFAADTNEVETIYLHVQTKRTSHKYPEIHQRYFIVMRTQPTLSFSFANNFLSRHLRSKRTFHRINVTPGRQFVEFYFVRASLCSARTQKSKRKQKMDAMACSDRLESRKVCESNRGAFRYITKQSYTSFPRAGSVRSEIFGMLKHWLVLNNFYRHFSKSFEVSKYECKKWNQST